MLELAIVREELGVGILVEFSYRALQCLFDLGEFQIRRERDIQF